MKLVELTDIFLKYPKTCLFSVALALAVSVTYVWSKTDLYESGASLVITPATPLNNAIRSSHISNLDLVGINVFQTNLSQYYYLTNLISSYGFFKYLGDSTDLLDNHSFSSFSANLKILNPHGKGIIRLRFTDSNKDKATGILAHIIDSINPYLNAGIIANLERSQAHISKQIKVSSLNVETEFLLEKSKDIYRLLSLTKAVGTAAFEILEYPYVPEEKAGMSKHLVFIALFLGMISFFTILLLYIDEYLSGENVK